METNPKPKPKEGKIMEFLLYDEEWLLPPEPVHGDLNSMGGTLQLPVCSHHRFPEGSRCVLTNGTEHVRIRIDEFLGLPTGPYHLIGEPTSFVRFSRDGEPLTAEEVESLPSLRL